MFCFQQRQRRRRRCAIQAICSRALAVLRFCARPLDAYLRACATLTHLRGGGAEAKHGSDGDRHFPQVAPLTLFRTSAAVAAPPLPPLQPHNLCALLIHMPSYTRPYVYFHLSVAACVPAAAAQHHFAMPRGLHVRSSTSTLLWARQSAHKFCACHRRPVCHISVDLCAARYDDCIRSVLCASLKQGKLADLGAVARCQGGSWRVHDTPSNGFVWVAFNLQPGCVGCCQLSI